MNRLRSTTPFVLLFAVAVAVLVSSALAQTSGTVRVAVSSEIETLDGTKVASALGGTLPIMQAFEGLTRITATGDLEPLLALSWEVEEDHVSWLFELRRDVVFHDGTAFDAEVVAHNIERWLDPDINFWRRRHIAPLTGVEVVDRYTVRLFTNDPFLLLPNVLADGGMVMHSPADIDAYGETLGTRPSAGTGPYRVVEITPGRSVTFERWEDYWSEPARNDRLEIVTVPDDQARMAMLQTGQIDINLYVPIPLRGALESAPDLAAVEVPSQRQYEVRMNHLDERFQDVRVREALNLAVDRETIINSIFRGSAVPAQSSFARGVFSWEPVVSFEYDPDRALSLLAEAGWETRANGYLYKEDERFSVTMIAPTGAYPMDSELSQVVAEYLRRIGVQVDLLSPGDYSVVRELTIVNPDARNTNELVMHAFAASYFDPLLRMNQYDTRFWAPAGVNDGFYSNERFDELNRQQSQEFDVEMRRSVLEEMQRILVAEDFVSIYLVQPAMLVGLRADIDGFVGHPGDEHAFSLVSRRQ